MSQPDPRTMDRLTEQLSAYLDGELGERERRQVEATLARDATARRVLEELRAVSAAVRGLPVEAGPADIRERVLRALERKELLEPMPGESPSGPLRPAWRFARLVAAAAVVALAVSVGFLAVRWGLQEPGEIQVAKLEEAASSSGGRAEGPEGSRAPVPAGGRSASGVRRAMEEHLSAAEGVVDEKHAAPQGRAEDQTTFSYSTLPYGLTAFSDARTPPDRWRTQSFHSVRPQVVITVSDPAAERAAAETVKQFFVANRLLDASRLPPEASLSPTQGLYLEGVPGVNVGHGESDQFLVRAPPPLVDRLVSEVQTQVAGAQVACQGDLSVWGFATTCTSDSDSDGLDDSAPAASPSPANVGVRLEAARADRGEAAGDELSITLSELQALGTSQKARQKPRSAVPAQEPIDVVIKVRVSGPATRPSTRPASARGP